MKNVLLLTLVLAFISPSLNAQATYGMVNSTSDRDAITTGQLAEKLGKKNPIEKVIVRGQVSEVGLTDSTWMKLTHTGMYDVVVTFLEKAFTVPTNIVGKKALVYGSASMKTISVAELKKQAQEAGKSKVEIATIKKEKVQIRIEAVGVKVE